MSTREEIVPLDPSIALRGGIFIPLNSKGAKLKPAACIFAGSDMNFPFIKRMRFILEAGFANCKGESKGLEMQYIPILAGFIYDMPYGSFHIMPKLSLGATVVDFKDGEGGSSRSVAATAFIGTGLVYELTARHLYAGIWPEYSFMRDKGGALHGISLTGGITYRF